MAITKSTDMERIEQDGVLEGFGFYVANQECFWNNGLVKEGQKVMAKCSLMTGNKNFKKISNEEGNKDLLKFRLASQEDKALRKMNQDAFIINR